MRSDSEIITIIDQAIRSVWVNEIRNDYENKRLLKEDTLKNAMYFHLRNRLGWLCDECNIRIFTEFTDWEFKTSRKIPDMVIAKVDMKSEDAYFGNAVTDCLAVIEFKYKSGFAANKDIYADFDKLKFYIKKLGLRSKFYMATIWEQEDYKTSWEEKNTAWAKGRVTELNASLRRSDGSPQFYVSNHR